MYLTENPLERVAPTPFGNPGSWAPAVLDALLVAISTDAPLAYWTGVQLGASEGSLVTIWADEADARAAASAEATTPERSIVRPGTCYRVTGPFTAMDGTTPPAVMQLTSFAGPRSEAQVHADELSNLRVSAALADLPGICGALIGYGDENACLVVSFADSQETLSAAFDRIMATELGPDEDPALLTGPDEVRICAVVAGSGPLAALEAATQGGVR